LTSAEGHVPPAFSGRRESVLCLTRDHSAVQLAPGPP